MKKTLLERLKSYGFSKPAMEAVAPIAEAVERSDVATAAVLLGQMAQGVCKRIADGTLSPVEADQYFTLLDLFVTEHCQSVALSTDMEAAIMEGMLLHDLGEEYGANLDSLNELAGKLIQRGK